MSTQTEEQKRKSKRTLEEIVQEIRTILSKTKAQYIREMCEAARDEHPDWDNKRIQTEIESICQEFGWNAGTVYVYLPSWIHNQKMVAAVKKQWEKKNKDLLEISEKNFRKMAQQPFKEPVLPSDGEEDPDEDVGEPMLREYGDNEESVLSLYAHINNPARELFKALTKKEIPGPIDNLVLEYLKPSREFRRGIFYEVDKNMRVSLYNTLVFTRNAIDDTLKLLDTIDKQEEGK